MDGKDFGLRLRSVREQRDLEGIEVARRALGPAATTEQHTQFANYLSRIEREGGNVGLEKLREIATGLGFAQMSAFWQAIEQTGNGHAVLALPNGGGEEENRLSLQPKGDHGNPSPAALSPVDIQSIERIVSGATDKINETIYDAQQRLAKSLLADAASRAKPTGRRRPLGARPRKTA